ncbi:MULTISPECIES: P-loop NTPase fold protein [unclassified Rhizobium]|uniref:KAP family P-loop NTPase fold protein n=1 Tax=unclassified Rhizobium TaxID=2613769 RepID=UPI00115F33AA|nr:MULTISPECIES: P-loop NTPase fold protein [unclassified Rhizobium]TQX90255.1 hypothetical protein EQW76_11165 [Rhizobium sp. rho-13.1]TQY16205.1 hypothetical protein EQW74_10755 [Rhizobium sp. rho-1.1]
MSEAVEDIWAGDLLERETAAGLLYTFVVSRMSERASAGKHGSYVMNIDAEWGQGKSFFMERLHKQVLANGHPAVFINAWRDDFSDDPFTAVLAEFAAYIEEFEARDKGVKDRLLKQLEVVKRNAGKFMWIAAKGMTGKLIEKAIGGGKDEIAGLLDGFASDETITTAAEVVEKPLADIVTAAVDSYATAKIEEFAAAKKSIFNFEQSFGEIVEALRLDGKAMPFFIFVDELDRCRPTYAISMLERIKHLFNVENVVFLIATDTEQLAHSIKAVYGEGFNSQKYLSRFFNRPYTLPTPSRYMLVRSMADRYGLDYSKFYVPYRIEDYCEVITAIANHYNIDNRRLEHMMDVLASITTVWNYQVPIHLIVLIPLIIAVLEKTPTKTVAERSDFFIRPNRLGHYLQLPTKSIPGADALSVADWINRTMGFVSDTTLGKAALEVQRELNNANGSPLLQDIGYCIMQELRVRGEAASSLINDYPEIISSMRGFTKFETISGD